MKTHIMRMTPAPEAKTNHIRDKDDSRITNPFQNDGSSCSKSLAVVNGSRVLSKSEISLAGT